MPEQTPTRNELATTRPGRPADRNRELVEGEQSLEDLLLPALEEGITLLDVEGSRGVEVLHALVIDHLLTSDGPAFWVDANGNATTTSMARLAPSRRLLNRVQVARGFTAYQHFAAVADLPAAIDEHAQATLRGGREEDPRTEREREASPHTPALLVVPDFDVMYRAEDALGDEQARTLLSRALARLRKYSEGYNVPIIVTRTSEDAFTAPIETVADHTLRCERTRMGPRFIGEEFETLLYPLGDGFYQTTLAYWREMLEARATQVGLEPSTPQPERQPEIGGEASVAPKAPFLDALRGGF